jgi:hypothetical protein
VGHGVQAEGAAQVGQVLKEGGDAPVIGPEECFRGQAGEQLRLGVAARAEPVRVRRQHPDADCQGILGHVLGGLG